MTFVPPMNVDNLTDRLRDVYNRLAAPFPTLNPPFNVIANQQWLEDQVQAKKDLIEFLPFLIELCEQMKTLRPDEIEVVRLMRKAGSRKYIDIARYLAANLPYPK